MQGRSEIWTLSEGDIGHCMNELDGFSCICIILKVSKRHFLLSQVGTGGNSYFFHGTDLLEQEENEPKKVGLYFQKIC